MFHIAVDATGRGFVTQDGVLVQRVSALDLHVVGGERPKAVLYVDPEYIVADLCDEDVEIVVNEVASNGDS